MVGEGKEGGEEGGERGETSMKIRKGNNIHFFPLFYVFIYFHNPPERKRKRKRERGKKVRKRDRAREKEVVFTLITTTFVTLKSSWELRSVKVVQNMQGAREEEKEKEKACDEGRDEGTEGRKGRRGGTVERE